MNPPSLDASSEAQATGTRTVAFGICAVVAARVMATFVIWRTGFSHVSDDDYARTVIAQSFAHQARLDPSGTSWLPFPFWLTGMCMKMFGRTIQVAQAVAWITTTFCAVALYLELRRVIKDEFLAVTGSACAVFLLWSAWLGFAAVPDGYCAFVVACVLVGLAHERGPSTLAYWLLFAATLSRYETWPLAGISGGLFICQKTLRRIGARPLALLPLAGPALWMAWNAHAHGDPFHFWHRVTRFHQAVAHESTWGARMGSYPTALWKGSPELVVAFVALVALMVARPSLRAHLRRPAWAVFGMALYLMLGSIREGAPTHHAERPWIGMGMALLAALPFVFSSLAQRERAKRGIALVICLACFGTLTLGSILREPPGSSHAEERRAQIHRGLELRSASRLSIRPCAYEHFALIAAYGAPERVTIESAQTAKDGPGNECPTVFDGHE